jgi:hypothetical protein
MDAMMGPKPSGPGNRGAAAGGLLVGLGGLLLVGRLTGGAFWPSGAWLSWATAWPLLPLGGGLGLLLLALAGGPVAGGLAVPGSVVTAVGLLLLVDRVTDQWQTWAYTWALAFPAAAGAGLWLLGRRGGRSRPAARGRRLTGIGLGLGAALAGVFELGLTLSGAVPAGLARSLGPALLLASGTYLLLRRGGRPAGAGGLP